MSREPSIQLKKSHLFNECNRDKVYPYTDAQYVFYTQTGTDEEKTVQEVLDGLLAKPDPDEDPIDPGTTGLTPEQITELYNIFKDRMYDELRDEILRSITLPRYDKLFEGFYDAETGSQISYENLGNYNGCLMTFEGKKSVYSGTDDVPKIYLHKNAMLTNNRPTTPLQTTMSINGEINAKGLYDTSEESNEQGQ